jgi:SAM-dependent methyltransferase
MHAGTVAVYDGMALQWEKARGKAHDDLGRLFRERAGSGLVADLGCGPGRYLPQIAGPVVGVDVSTSMLALAARHGHPVLQADLESLPFADQALAGAFARHSYLHIPRLSMGRALADLRRALSPGGFVMLSLIEGNYEGDALADDDFPGRYFTFWERSHLVATLTSVGFIEVTVDRVARARGQGDLLATARR